MKNLLILMLLFVVPFSAQSQKVKGIKSFYKKYKKTEGSVNFVLPGFLVWLGTGLANEMTNDPEAKAALRLASKFKTMRMLVIEDAMSVTEYDFNQLVHSVKMVDFEDMISVRDKDADVHIMARGKNDKLKNLLVLVKEEDSFVMMSMKTKIRPKDLNQFIDQIMKSQKVQNKLKKQPEPTPEPEEIPTEKNDTKKKKAKARA